MDAIFWAAACRRREPPPRFGKPDTAARHSRRPSGTGLRDRLPRALVRPDAPAPLRTVEHRARRARRRVGCRRGLRVTTAA